MENTSAKENNSGNVCPHQMAFMLDNPFRRLFQNPEKMLKPYIAEGDTEILRRYCKKIGRYMLNFLCSVTHGCNCGYFGDIKRECHCSHVQIRLYRTKISGPLMDRKIVG